ncbi:MAG: RNA pseudouridine synthase, partial [Flavobacteriaceae bacterium]|nr:RNA pseudouridine synthase [Flavobacteriaceae bacterium]
MRTTIENIQILYEDNHIIIVNKRVGDIVQGDKTGDIPLGEIVKNYIQKKYEKPGNVFLGVVHRIDRPTSGIVIFARTSKALERLNEMLREKKIEKTYWAIIKNNPPKESDTLIHFLKKNPKNNKSTTFSSEKEESKKAILHYKLLKKLDKYSLLEINLETGRHHQIRCQLAAIGCPIKGDLKYGFPR